MIEFEREATATKQLSSRLILKVLWVWIPVAASRFLLSFYPPHIFVFSVTAILTLVIQQCSLASLQVKKIAQKLK